MKVRNVVVLAVSVWAGVAGAGCGKSPGGTGGGSSLGSSSALPSGAVPVTGVAPTVPKEPEKTAPAELAVRSGPLSFAPIAKQADPSVVTIATVGEEQEPSTIFGARGRRRETKGLGTGFIIDKDGTILTNNHVIEGAGTMTVKLSDDTEYPGKVIGKDPRTDIAVVKVDTKGKTLQALALGDSDVMEVGDWVVAIGNPFGLSHTVSAGIVSAKGRSRDDVPLDPSGFYNFLQTDASINPGNSGGPLLNLKGEVVGINSAIRGGGAQGIGFAIPINMVKQLLPALEHDGHVTRSALGVRIRDIKELAPEDKVALKITEDKGTVIELVQPGGPADKAGLQAGDIILTFDSQPVDRGTHLQWLASTAGVGKTVLLRVARLGKVFDLKLTLGLLPEEPTAKRHAP
jgi:serine protease Do